MLRRNKLEESIPTENKVVILHALIDFERILKDEQSRRNESTLLNRAYEAIGKAPNSKEDWSMAGYLFLLPIY